MPSKECQVTKLTKAVRAFLVDSKLHPQANTEVVRARFFEVLHSVHQCGEHYEKLIPICTSEWEIFDVAPGNVEAVCHLMSGHLCFAAAAILTASKEELVEIGDYLSGQYTSHP